MNKKKWLYVANWKMRMSVNEAQVFCVDNHNELIKLQNSSNAELVICPEFSTIFPVIQILKDTNIKVGAQNCSQFKQGAYTGEVAAQSLAQIGCSYCIIGHSERRTLFGENNETVAQKTKRVLEHELIPIICFGETKKEYEDEQTNMVLEQQLTPVINVLVEDTWIDATLCFAYEPIWSIGTGLIAESTYLENIFSFITDLVGTRLPNAQIMLLYGGSVNNNNIKMLKKNSLIEGFLIGGASLDFQKFQKIVLYK